MTRREYEGSGRCLVGAPERVRHFEAVADLESRVVRIIARGELDCAARPQFDDLVDAVAISEPFFLIDCAGLSFVDAGGISSLVRAHRFGAVVVGIGGAARRTLALVGLHEVLSRPAEVLRA